MSELLDALGIAHTATTPAISSQPRNHRQHWSDIVYWHDAGKNQVEIAELLDVDQSTVSRTLSKLRPTVDIAVKVLEAQALPAACRVVDLMDSANDRVSLDASKTILGANNLLGDGGKSSNQTNIQVIIGAPSFAQAIDAGVVVTYTSSDIPVTD